MRQMQLSNDHQCEGKCSACGSERLDYGETDVQGEFTQQEWTCLDCGAEGREFYDLTYAGTARYIDESEVTDDNTIPAISRRRGTD